MAYRIIPLLARRFLFSKSSDGFLSFITWVSVVGVSLGVLALVVVMSVINGFEGELARAITGMNGHVLLYTRGQPIARAGKVEKKIRELVPETTAITHSFVAELMIAGPDGVSGVIMEGVDTKTLGTATTLPKHFISGRMPNPCDRCQKNFMA